MEDRRFDDMFFLIAKEQPQGVVSLLDAFFAFLFRKTDFYYECEPGENVGFPPGIAEHIVLQAFRKWQNEHYKSRAPPKPKNFRAVS
eukprot:CAMPEP_0201281276 /NCGR_PEP_ID=MMETSP1317-20130820/2167_1 /ASSEMBLY_ACC=CAM_ASM_000770 /TAXON_ID=187299 /ORGANISM="Undescribed Undescribed, Strain Undescribed" /LENGTH=86 /DNA_ID=CAMNT_0047590701 /DNA_START=21 /DNA_END=281 /DNA_ORIENTATION=+